MLNWIIEGIRVIVWALCSAMLYLMDMAYSGIKAVILLDFSGSELLWKIVSAFEGLIGLAILIRVIVMVLKLYSDDEEMMKFKIPDFLSRFFLVSVILVLLPFILGFAGKLTTFGVDNIGYFAGSPSSQVPSTTIVSAYTNSTNGTDNVYKLTDVDINKRQPGNRNEYIFFPDISQIFIMFIIGTGASAIMVLTTVDVAKRVYELVILVAACPLPLSAFITKSNNSFSEWWKMIVAIYATNYAQVVLVILTMTIMSSQLVQSGGVWVQLSFLIGGLLAALGGIPQVARLLGAETGLSNTLQQVAHLRQATSGAARSAGAVAGAASAGAMKLGGNVASKGAYGAGRLMGGVSANEYNSSSNFSSTGAKLNSPGNSYNQGRAAKSSPASSIANAAYSMKPSVGRSLAVGAVNMTGHIYEKSINKVSESTSYRAMNKFKQNKNSSPIRNKM